MTPEQAEIEDLIEDLESEINNADGAVIDIRIAAGSVSAKLRDVHRRLRQAEEQIAWGKARGAEVAAAMYETEPEPDPVETMDHSYCGREIDETILDDRRHAAREREEAACL